MSTDLDPPEDARPIPGNLDRLAWFIRVGLMVYLAPVLLVVLVFGLIGWAFESIDRAIRRLV